ncbi:E3 ubiquitin-protein ligase RNF31 [Hydra vulgaris]|uniref:E3 ubiquitin-protein ligase RNF31 n=1 Tax=Hydra vulgaris TaxID=6087 RepID=UPI001F5F3B2E|nr:E3 ubiquitin-protein ligase RNF31 [Hydra vulgaris]
MDKSLNLNLSDHQSLVTDIKKPIPPPRPVPVPRPRNSSSLGNNDSCMSKIGYKDEKLPSNFLFNKSLSRNLGLHEYEKENLSLHGDEKEIKEKINIDSNMSEKFSYSSSLSFFNPLFNRDSDRLKSLQAHQVNEPFFYLNDLSNKYLQHDEFVSYNNDDLYDSSITPVVDKLKKPLFENENELIMISKGRKKLQQLVKDNASSADKRIVAEKLLNLDVAIILKYHVLDILDFLLSNKDIDISKIPTAFNLLEKYGMTLLKEESLRHPSWRKISTSSNLFINSVGTVKGADSIIRSMGYTEKIKQPTGDILVFPLGVKPNYSLVMDLVIDLLIAKYEIDFLLNHKHPYFEILHMTGSIPEVYFTYNVSNINPTFAVEQNDSLVYQGPKSLEFAFNSPLSRESSLVTSNVNISTATGFFLCSNCNSRFIEQPKFCQNCGHQMQGHQSHNNNQTRFQFQDQQSSIKTELKQEHIKRTHQMQVQQSHNNNQTSFQFPDQQSSIKTELKQEHIKRTHSVSSFEVRQTKEAEKFTIPQQWSCQYCTLLNDLSVSICQACEQPSPNQKKLNEAQTSNLDDKQQIEFALKKQRLIKEYNEDKIRQEKELQRQLVISTQNKMKQNASNIANIFHIAENEGFSVQLCEMALNCVQNQDWDSIRVWIKKRLPELTDKFMEYSKQVFSQQNEIVSEKEAHQFLYDYKIDMRLAFVAFRRKREKQILDLKSKFSVTELEIHNVLFISEGEQMRAEELLYKNINGNEIRESLKKMPKVFFEKLADRSIPEEVKCRMILGEYPRTSWGRAEMCLKLINLNKYEVEDCLEAVKSNTYYNDCIQFLECECCMCLNTYPRHKLTSNLHCQCQYCFDCYIEYLDVSITQNHIRNLVCANCQLPTEEAAHKSEYFGNLDNQVQHFVATNKLAPERHTLFQEKLRDFNLLSDPKFRWCAHCPSYGFIWENEDNKMRCNKCQNFTCFLCKEKWLPQHDGITCEKFKEWKDANDPELQKACATDLLSKNGIECPECHFKYILVRGGCMHFTCTQCGYEFCSGCFMSFLKGGRCQVNPECANKGLHAHHPRDCYFYLRDKSVNELRTLLEKNNVEFDKDRPNQEMPDNQINGPYRCTIPISEDYLDKPCEKDSPDNMAGLCELHYIEYLVALINKSNLDPVLILSIQELNVVLTRSYKDILEQNENEAEEEFHERLREYVRTELPLLKRK